MEKIIIGPETLKFVNDASDRQIQNQIYITLRKIEIRQDQSLNKIAIITGIAITYFVCSIIAAIIIIGSM